MDDGRSTTGNCKMIELFQKMSITKKLKWSGDVEQLKSFVRYLPGHPNNCEFDDRKVTEERVRNRFECVPHSLTITFYENNTVQFHTDAEEIKQYISSKLEVGCCEIYENESTHITQRHDKEAILGYPHQFCAAFYHTHRWRVGNRVREHQCLDERRCIISKRALDEGFKVQPKTVVAVVRFKNVRGDVVYEAKYTNCVPGQKHAEDFFKEDVEGGQLKTKIDNNPKGTITMYLTLPPCNRSVSTKPEGTAGTPRDKSCCDTLKTVLETLKKKQTRLDIKVTHPYRLSTSEALGGDNETLRKNAVKGIKDLMGEDIVDVSAMNKEDWDYLFSMTKQPRDELDHEIRDVLDKIRNTDEERQLNRDNYLFTDE